MNDASTVFVEKERDTGASFEVCWLPSIPIINKRRLPSVPCVAFFYSEDSDEVLHVFETDDLKDRLHSYSRVQAAVLGKDQNCRISWLEVNSAIERKKLVRKFTDLYRLDSSDT